jgi:hypothetical protein
VTVASAEQDQWVEICDAVRGQLARAVVLMPAMNPGEVQGFVSSIETAMWNEVTAHTLDAAIEQRRRVLEREAAFGG